MLEYIRIRQRQLEKEFDAMYRAIEYPDEMLTVVCRGNRIQGMRHELNRNENSSGKARNKVSLSSNERTLAGSFSSSASS